MNQDPDPTTDLDENDPPEDVAAEGAPDAETPSEQVPDPRADIVPGD